MDVAKEGDVHHNGGILGGKGLLLPDQHQQQNHNNNNNHKKQVRRRLHTSRPYQERLLNMAEARKEIVAALKFHRAAMKQSSNRRQQQEAEETDVVNLNLQIPNNNLPPPPITHEEEINHGYNNYNHNQSNSISSINSSSINSCCSYFQQPNSGHNYLWPYSSSSSSQFGSSSIDPFSTNNSNNSEILDFPLPNQTLGLNLNFNQFANLETSVCWRMDNTNSYSSNSNSNSPQWVLPVQDHGVKPELMISSDVKMEESSKEEEMETVCGGGDEQNLMTSASAWWFKVFKNTTETKPEQETEPDCNYLFDETDNSFVPHWLSNEEESSCFHDHSTHDHSLPCMDIGEIETIDGEWLS